MSNSTDQTIEMQALNDQKNNDFSVKIQTGEKEPSRESSAAQNFTGLSKEELMKYATDPFWVRMRWILFIGFWVVWVGLLVAAILIIVFSPKCPPKPDVQPYQSGMIYKVVPESFKDSTGDGFGDLAGISSKLDYIKELGANILLLGSVLPGFRATTNFQGVDSSLGNQQALTDLISQAHKSNLKVVIEFNPNAASTSLYNESSGSYVTAKTLPATSLVGRNDKSAWNKLLGGKSTDYFYSSNGQNNIADLNLGNGTVYNDVWNVVNWILYTVNADGILLKEVSFLYECSNLQSASTLDSSCALNQDADYAFVNNVSELIKLKVSENRKRIRMLFVEAVGNATEIRRYYENGAQLVLTEKTSRAVQNALPTKNASDWAAVFVKRISNYLGMLRLNDSYFLTQPADMTSRTMLTVPWAFSSQEWGRFGYYLDLPAEKVITGLSAFLPGVAYTYYGDEIELEGNGYVFDDILNKRKMQWDSTPLTAGFTSNTSAMVSPLTSTWVTQNVLVQNAIGSGPTMSKFMKKVLALRAEPSFLWGSFYQVNTSSLGVEFTSTFIFFRVANLAKTDKDAPQASLVLANLGPEKVVIKNLTDLVVSAKVAVSNETKLTNAAYELPTKTTKVLVRLALVSNEFDEGETLDFTKKPIALASNQLLVLDLQPDPIA